MLFLNRLLKVFFLLFFFYANARPPKDLILMPPAGSTGVRIIRDKNVTFTSEQPDVADVSTKIKTIFDVKGRSRPNRSGSVVANLTAGTVVFPFRWSADEKWVAVRVESSGLKLWMPRTVLPKMDQKFKLAGVGKKETSSAPEKGKKSNQETSSSDSDVEEE